MIAKMQKISIVCLKDFKDKIVDFLYNKGFIEIISAESNGKKLENTEENTGYKLAKVKRALEILSPYFEEKKSFLEKLLPEKRKITADKIKNLQTKFSFIETAEQAEKLGQDLNVFENKIAKLKEERNSLVPWLNLNLKTSDFETRQTKVILGSIEKKNYKYFKREILSKFKQAEINWVSYNDTIVNLVVFFFKKNEKELLLEITAKGFKQTEISLLENSPKKRAEEIKEETKKIESKANKVKTEIKELSRKYLLNLQVIYDVLSWQSKQEQVQKEFSFTKETFSILGWIKKNEISELKQGLEGITQSVEVSLLKTKQNETVPIAMENPRFLKPFEFVTNIYGFPKHDEIDPTPYLAGFFIIFFGMCLTDAGYGLSLALGSFLALKFLKFSSGFKKLLKLLFYGGIITFIAGALTGGWFGAVLENLPAFISQPLIRIRQINPVDDPITILIVSLILGYVHLFFGSVIDLVWKVKNNQTKQGLVDSGVWLYFLSAVVLWILFRQSIFIYLIYSSLILIVLTQGKGKNMITKILGGLGELYFGITGYISDILSYSRLLALGLATGIIGMVINIVGSMANEMIPYVGWILMILVLAAGHLMNLVISLVGAFVHAGRLQYVEFFKKFFEGGGREFKPFSRSGEYVEIVKE